LTYTRLQFTLTVCCIADIKNCFFSISVQLVARSFYTGLANISNFLLPSRLLFDANTYGAILQITELAVVHT